MKKQNLVVLGILTVITIGALSLFSWNTYEVSNEIAKTENMATVELSQNMETKEFKIFSDFIYDIGPRFRPIKKSEIDQITSIVDILDNEIMQNMVTLKSTSIILVKDDMPSNIRITGSTSEFNKEQLDFLKSSHYSTNFGMRVEYEEKDQQSGYTFDSYREPYMTIVPEEQAYYSDGKDALKLFLKESCQDVLVGVDPEKLKPAKLYFTVSKYGKIENIKLDRESGYPDVDKKMIELITNTPGTWSPAKNKKGETVKQELVVSFGLMGC